MRSNAGQPPRDAARLLLVIRSLLRRSVAFIGAALTCCAAMAQASRMDLGAMIHFLPAKNDQAAISRLDPKLLAEQLHRMGVDYLVLTLGQNSGQFISPNASLNEICPDYVRSESARDIPAEFISALRPYRIKLVLYLPFRAPQHDPSMMNCLGDVGERSPPPEKFIENWTRVIAFWSRRYGADLVGWWFDGAYNTERIDAQEWASLCRAAYLGNERRLVAFNRGQGAELFQMRVAPCQNWMAGEAVHFDAGLPITSSAMRPHVLTPIEERWGTPSPPAYSTAEIARIAERMKQRGGMLTLAVPLSEGDVFGPPEIAAVQSAASAMRKRHTDQRSELHPISEHIE